jgi:hypothetical protein
MPFEGSGALLQDNGEPVCRFCCATGKPIFTETLAMLTSCLRTGSFGQIEFTSESLHQAGSLLDNALSSHAGRRLKSLEFLQQVSVEIVH